MTFSPALQVIESDQSTTTLIRILGDVVRQFPDRPALETADESFTYQQMWDAAADIARSLVAKGIRPNDRVGVHATSGTSGLYLSILGCLMAGTAYVPVDIDDPDERAQRIFELSGVSAILDGHFSSRPYFPRTAEELPSVTADNDAWVIFTSGSTGEPKGVAVRHGAAAAWITAEKQLWDVHPQDRVLAGLSVGFDASCEEMWSAWANGACLVAAPRAIVRSGEDFGDWILQNKVNVISTVPSIAQFFTDAVLAQLKLLILGGETLPATLAQRLSARVETWNTYGPTEATVVSTAARVSPERPLTIGHALSGWRTAVVDENGYEVEDGLPGELAIAGVGLGRYLDPALDAVRYAPIPAFGTERAYRSGDVVKASSEGYIFIGRQDDQVKIGGRRIELGEVDALLEATPGVVQAAATVRKTESGASLLVGYVTGNADPATVREHVAQNLTGGIRPLILQVEEMPLRTSGKIDRAALPWPPPSHHTGAHPALDGTQALLAQEWEKELGPLAFTRDSHFFDLGGTSIAAARLVSQLRNHFPTVAVADVYENPILQDLAERLDSMSGTRTGVHARSDDYEAFVRPRARKLGTLMLVALALILAFTSIPWLVDLLAFDDLVGDASVPKASWAILIPIWMVFGTAFGRAVFAYLTRRILLPHVTPGRYSRFSSVALRLWLIDRLADVFHTDSLAGTPWAARMARLAGFDVHPTAALSTLPSPASFVTIGAFATIEAEVELQGWYLDGTDLVVGPVHIEGHARVAQRASLLPGVRVGRGAEIEIGSVVTHDVPADEKWAGSPAHCVGHAGEGWPTLAERTDSPHPKLWRFAFIAGVLSQSIFPLIAALPSLAVVAALASTSRVSLSTLTDIIFLSPLLAACYAVSYSLVLAISLRYTGRLIKPGLHPNHGKVAFGLWLSGNLMEQAIRGMFPLFATLFAPPWARLAGINIGRGSEVCTTGSITHLVSLGENSMITDDVCFATTRSRDGWMVVSRIRVGNRSFLGNGAIIPGGTIIGDDCLIGVQTISPQSVPDNTSWFGVPALEFPRQPTSADEKRTYHPTRSLRIQRYAWETLRILLPYTVSIVLATLTYEASIKIAHSHGIILMMAAVPAILLASGVIATLFTIAAKWVLIGRYPVRDFPLWSSFVWRDEIINSLQEMLSGEWLLRGAMGTAIVNWYLRAMGAKIGPHVSIDTLAITEYDQVRVDAFATVNREACLETHLFQDRVLQIGPTHLGRRSSMAPRSAVLPFTALGDDTRLGFRSVVLRGESLPAATSWMGAPVSASSALEPASVSVGSS